MLSGWQIDEMVARDADALWERLNAPDPFEDQLRAAAKQLEKAAVALNTCTDRIIDAGCELDETPMREVVDSLCDNLEQYRVELNRLIRMYERGVRE